MEQQRQPGKQEKKTALYVFFLILLILYPLRHVNKGIDLWDVGYNYANFTNMGLEHMDSMWFFSTYLATAVGHLMTLLPFGDTLLGLNVYTGLFISVLAAAGYLFFTKCCKVPYPVAFAGEFLAISLCWCPTALVYNYLTYLLLSAAVLLLYVGLERQKRICLILAGAALGSNVLVRFPNLTEMVLILPVWAYAFWQDTEESQETRTMQNKWKKAASYTGFCVLGYGAALLVWGVWIGWRYGLRSYVEAIQRLFAMTDTAVDYKPMAMLLGIVHSFAPMLFWYPILALFLLLSAAPQFLWRRLQRKTQDGKETRMDTVFGLVAPMLVTLLMGVFLYYEEFCGLDYRAYESVFPITLLLFSVIFVLGVWQMCNRHKKKNERFLAAVSVLLLFLTAIGSDNGILPSFNNLFLVLPYTIWQIVSGTVSVFRRESGAKAGRPVMVWLCGVLVLFGLQATLFGATFCFGEGRGMQGFSASVQDNPVLKGVKMNEKQADWMQKTTDFIAGEHLGERELISYEGMPSLSFYLGMPAAFNPWCELPSYSVLQMQKDMAELRKQIDAGQKEKPVIILNQFYFLCSIGKRDLYEEQGVDPAVIDAELSDPKWLLLSEFMEDYSYEYCFGCDQLGIWK